MNNKPHGIMFHHFHDETKHPKGQGSISGDQFRKILNYLIENFNLLNAIEWLEKSQNNTLSKNDICITFDDNLLCQFDIALPILEEFKIQAFWFVYTSPILGIKEKIEIYRFFRFDQFKSINDFYDSFNKTIETSEFDKIVKKGLLNLNINEFLSSFPYYTKEDKIFRFIRDEILGQEKYYKIMDAMIENNNFNVDETALHLWNDESKIKYLHETGHIIGLHSHTHPTSLKSLNYSGQLEEYTTNRNILNSITGSNIFTMSHPCNSYNNDTLKILEEMNVTFGFRANMDDGFSSRLEYPRLDHTLLMNSMI